MNRLSQLTISPEGFVFDPTCGESFSVNGTGCFILNGLQQHKSPEMIAQELGQEYEIPLDEAERDVLDFKTHLQSYGLL